MVIRETLSKSPIQIAFSPIKFFFRLLATLVALLIALIIISTIWYGFTRGELPEQIRIGLEKVNLDKPVVSAVNFIYNIATGRYEEVDTGFSGTTRTVEETIGINIKDFKPNKDSIGLNEPVLARATVEIIKTPENKEINLDFSEACYLEDYTDLESPREVIANPTEKRITNQENYVFPVRCEFPQGFSEIGAYYGTDVTKKTEIKKTSDLKKLRFMPRFSYAQEIDWQPFTKSIYESSDKTTNPTWDLSEGPASLRIGSKESQPFYAEEQHELEVYLESNWPGNIKLVKAIRLEVPNDIELLTDNKFCDFVSSGNGYILKAPALEETAIDCSSKSGRERIKMLIPRVQSDITFDECIKTYKNEFKFSCPFLVKNAEQIASRTQINIKANYIYEMQGTSSITLVDTENI